MTRMLTTREAAEMVNCSQCLKALEGEEEIESPHKVYDETVCDECYDDWFSEESSECPVCCDYFLEEDLSEYFIVFDSEVAEPGIYKPISFPYYSQPMIGHGNMDRRAISRLGFIPTGVERNFYPCALSVAKGNGSKGAYLNSTEAKLILRPVSSAIWSCPPSL